MRPSRVKTTIGKTRRTSSLCHPVSTTRWPSSAQSSRCCRSWRRPENHEQADASTRSSNRKALPPPSSSLSAGDATEKPKQAQKQADPINSLALMMKTPRNDLTVNNEQIRKASRA